MSKNSVSSGNASIASGDQETNNEIPNANASNSDDKVQYATYQKVLGEKKRAAEELANAKALIAQFEANQKDAEEKALKEKEDWKTAYELKAKLLEETESKFKTQTQIIEDSKKFSAFLDNVNGTVDKKFYQLIDISNVIIDPTTGQPDPASAQQAAREFEKNFGDIVKKGTGPKLPNASPQNSTGTITRDEWLQLPSKEMKARLKDVMGTHKQ